MTPFRQTRTIVDPTGRSWTAQLTGWGTAVAGDLRKRMDQPSTRLLTFESNGELRSVQIAYDTAHLDEWTDEELLEELRSSH